MCATGSGFIRATLLAGPAGFPEFLPGRLGVGSAPTEPDPWCGGEGSYLQDLGRPAPRFGCPIGDSHGRLRAEGISFAGRTALPGSVVSRRDWRSDNLLNPWDK
ncbi:hypothetical protein Pen02_32820 [Plantactinospora endophytica]|uniref:Uncharacterized protein n=1 Tax=Plantactinospora endophytica TaxID=673535 RepID=A0ABQ4E0Z5_9ACTN|nr:hypothetical protein Pen02_32820 [Plantactinospora endophytica]